MSQAEWRVLATALRNLPETAGVYVVSRGDKVLYVGQSKNLRRRWINHHRTAELAALGASSITWTSTDVSELGALEARLIKDLRPVLHGARPVTRGGHPIPTEALWRRGQEYLAELESKVFWGLVVDHLRVMERSQAWLARRLGRNPQTLCMYRKGHRPTPEWFRSEIALLLDIREQLAA